MKQLLLLLLLFPAISFAQKRAYPPHPPSIVLSQACGFPGTTPETAIPVCGTSVFHQDSVFDCPTYVDINPTNKCTDGSNFPSNKSFWYKFSCFSAGDLTFAIKPLGLGDDYDWILFDITGHAPQDVFTDLSLIISLNGADRIGPAVITSTGASVTGTSDVFCYTANPATSQFNSPVPLFFKRDYLLMVTSYPNQGSTYLGYDLSFGGTAGITDGALPSLDRVVGGCTNFKVFFATDIKCNSVTPTGSEFTINPGNIKPVSVSSLCDNGAVATKSLTVNLATALAPGNYTLTINNGTDANTYTNVCDNAIPEGTSMNFTVNNPISSFSSPTESCFGSTASFLSLSDPVFPNTVTSWHWDFGDPASGAANTSALQNPTHIFSSYGTFTVKHWIVNSGGCNSDTLVHTVNVIPQHDIALTGGTVSQTACINTPINPITLTISGGATGIFNVFNLPPGVTATLSGNIITIAGTPTTANTYNFSIATAGNSCPAAVFMGSIIVTGDAVLTHTSAAGTDAQVRCRNSAIDNITYVFSGTATGVNVTGLPPGVSWSFFGNTVTISGTPTVSSPTAYTYTVSTLGPCAKPSLTGTILVNALPTAAFTIIPPACETRTISFTDGSAANIGVLDQWAWDFGDGSPGSTAQNPTHLYAAAGPYTVTLTVRNDKGCISDPVASSVINIDSRPQAGFIIPEVCLNDTYAQFTDTSKLQNAAIDRWEWNFGDPGSGAANTSSLQHPTHSYTAVGSYTVRLIVWNNAKGCRDTIIQPLFVNGSFPVANFNVSNPATLCANQPVSIAEASTVFPGSISKVEIYWDNVNAPAVFDTDNTPFTGKLYTHLYPNFQSPLTKTFTIRYRAYSGVVCVNDKLANITVHASPLVQFNNMPNSCLLIPPFQLTQAGETGAVPGTGVYSGSGVSPSGMFDPQAAGVGTHTLTYTFTSTAAGCVDSKSNTITVLDTAHAAFSFVSPSCEQVPTSFTDMSTAPAAVTMNNTVWNFGDLSPDENHLPGTTFGHLFPGPGTYTVTMYNISAAGCRSTVASRLVTIDPNHSISLNSANNIQTHCINNPMVPITYTLANGATGATVSNLPPGVTYSVTGNVLTIQGTPASTLNSPYNYTVQTTGNTCVAAQATGTLTVEPDHTIAYTSGIINQSVCVNSPIDPVVFTLGGGATGVIINNLPPGVSYTVSGNTVTISGTPTTTAGGPVFNYAIQTTGNSCIKANTTGGIKVNDYPIPDFNIDKPGYCLPNAIVKFNNASTMPDGSLMTYLWDFDDPSSGINNASTLVHPSHRYSNVGPFQVKLTARSLAVLNNNVIGCPHDTTINITNIHPQPMANFTQSKPGACFGDVVSFTDRSLPLDGVTTQWFWNMGDGTTFNVPNFTYTHADTLQYNIQFYTVNSHGCNSDTINRPFKVYPNPTVNAGADRTVLQGGRVQLSPVTTGVELQYLWTPNMYLLNNNNTIKNPVAVNVQESITYTLVVTARGGCQRRDDIYIKILKPPVIPNTFTPNNDGINDKWVISYLNDYPDCQVEVFTRAGQLVFKSTKGYGIPWDGKRNGQALPFDTYYYIIEPGNGREPITGYITLVK